MRYTRCLSVIQSDAYSWEDCALFFMHGSICIPISSMVYNVTYIDNILLIIQQIKIVWKLSGKAHWHSPWERKGLKHQLLWMLPSIFIVFVFFETKLNHGCYIYSSSNKCAFFVSSLRFVLVNLFFIWFLSISCSFVPLPIYFYQEYSSKCFFWQCFLVSDSGALHPCNCH